MNLSRKEFLAKGFLYLGRMLHGESQLPSPPAATLTEYRVAGVLLRVDNGRCLAHRSGCFTCLEHCPQEAISLELGSGIRIDAERCDGCGACAGVCPLAPAVVSCSVVEMQTTKRRSL
jgi:Pyruvate/2-oxoacid:ferredoxin oxidoreductase delta subunit